MRSRIIEYLDYKGISKYRFYQDTGLSNGFLDKSGGISISSYEKISSSFPDLNMDWLRTGEGDMLISEESNILKDGKELDEEDYRKAIAIGLPLIPEREAAFRGGDIGEVNLSSPIVSYWYIPNIPKNSEIITVYGNSMDPRIPSGSRIAICPYSFRIDEPTAIEFGRIFAVVLEDRTTGEYRSFVKYLRRHTDKALEKKYWVARSENQEEYDDFEVEISQVRGLYVVESIISMAR